ncbi:MAG: hypothetical protein LBG83_05525 [Oscillospiraceae bacterium]|jgi:hypothetical protein|nr:hypothetical protein [Oscillospiraceae bacterium]
MVIKITKATRFFCICALLLVTALISIGTKSVTVSAPYTPRGAALPLLIYRATGAPTALRPRDVQTDLAWLAKQGYTALSEQELVAALRRQIPLPEQPILLMFDDAAKEFRQSILPLLERERIPWFSASKSADLSNELRAAGFPVKRMERTAGLGLEDLLD